MLRQRFRIFAPADADISEKSVFGTVPRQQHNPCGRNAGNIRIGCEGSAGRVARNHFVTRNRQNRKIKKRPPSRIPLIKIKQLKFQSKTGNLPEGVFLLLFSSPNKKVVAAKGETPFVSLTT